MNTQTRCSHVVDGHVPSGIPWVPRGDAGVRNAGDGERRVEQRYLTKEQIAKFLCVSQRTIDSWRKEYGLPTIKVCNVCRFVERDVRNWFEKFRETKGGNAS